MKRGVVAFPIENNGNSMGEFAPSTLRHYALYWDKVDWPDNNVLTIGVMTPDLDFLASAGVLERSMVLFDLTRPGIYWSEIQLNAFEARERAEPGVWSLAQRAYWLASSSVDTSPMRTIQLELQSILPVPGDDVSLQDVLEFKVRREAELHQFRAALEDLCRDVAMAPDKPLATLQAQERLKIALKEWHQVFGERFHRRLLSTVRLPVVAEAAGIAALLHEGATAIGVPVSLAAAGSSVTGFLSASYKEIRKSQRVSDRAIPYAYLFQIESELK